MTKKNNKTVSFDELEVDPLDELNQFDEDFTSIETEKDFFDEIEQSDLESVPVYDSESGKIIEDSAPISQVQKTQDKEIKEDIKDEKGNKKSKNKEKKLDLNLSKKIKIPTSNSSKPKTKKSVKKLTAEKIKKDDTKLIDNVKVDEDGVPLLNQFDTEKIKESIPTPRFTIKKFKLSKILVIVFGLIVTITGIIQAMNDVVRISDHVMYGEHGSIAFGLIFLGIIIIVLAFYKELLQMFGLNNLNNMMDDIDSPSKHPKKNKKYDKK